MEADELRNLRKFQNIIVNWVLYVIMKAQKMF